MDVNHGYMVSQGNRMVRTRWGDSEGTYVPVHPSPGFYSHPETFPDFTKLRDQGLQLPVCTTIALHVPWEL